MEVAMTRRVRIESFFHGGKLNMVIQGYKVNVSSQRTFLSVQSSTVSATRENHTTSHTGATGQDGGTATLPDHGSWQQGQNQNGQGQNQDGQGQNQNGQGQNQNGQGQNQNGQGQNVNNQGQDQNGQGQNVNNQGQNQNGQGQNVNNQGQSNADIFRTMLQNARGETINRLSRSTAVSGVSNVKNQKIPVSPKELRARLSQMIYELLTGKSFKLKPKNHQHIENINEARDFGFSIFFGGAIGFTSITRPHGVAEILPEGFHYETETVSYQANGVIHTADGRTITVDISMHMSREFVSFMGISEDALRLVDPLVINYGGTAASLLGERFMFDLTMDGSLDSLAILGEGSGFLAIDRNGDGKINDGSELFGPKTGCGFSELRKYDTDGNGWIDENDEIFDKLVVWRRDKDGNDIVYTLRELGIGAIFLGDISTEFSFKGENNETLGVMRSTSFFLKQCGDAGTLSHIDLMLET
jgi:hypothetical protein